MKGYIQGSRPRSSIRVTFPNSRLAARSALLATQSLSHQGFRLLGQMLPDLFRQIVINPPAHAKLFEPHRLLS